MTSRGPRSTLLLMWGAWLLMMASVQMPAPLYHRYADAFGFSSLVLTLVFAVYAAVLIVATMLFGRLSDRFGRRPVLVAGFLVAATGALLFGVAGSTGTLFAARSLQGLAVGIVSGPATAALVEAAPEGAGQLPALLAGLAQAGGSALGPFVAGAFAQWAPDPLHLTFWVAVVVLVAAAAVVGFQPEPAQPGSERWRVQLPRVPREQAVDFARVAVTAALVWGSVSLFLAVVGSAAAQFLGTSNLAVLGIVVGLALATSCAAQVGARRLTLGDRPAQAAGLVVLAAGLAALVVAIVVQSLTLLLVASAVAGVGHGLAFLRAQHELNLLAPPDRRGEVTAAFICCIYVVVVAAVVGSGLLSEVWSLPTAVGVVAAVLAIASLAAAGWQRFSGPATPLPEPADVEVGAH